MYLAVAMDLKPPRDSVPRYLTILKLPEGRIVYESGEDRSSVDAVAWSADGRYLAALRRAPSGRLKSPLDILSAMFGHPVQYSDYWIEVIGNDGKRIGQAQIASDVRSSWGELIWDQ
jgi:hypothetical protein